MGVTVNITVDGAEETAKMLGRLANALDRDLPRAFRRVQQNIYGDIFKLFDTSAQGRWARWTKTTEELRRDPPDEDTAAASGPVFGRYYANNPGPALDRVGVWTGGIRAAFTSETRPGYVRIGANSMELGIEQQSDNRKYDVFVQGRPGSMRAWYGARFGASQESWYLPPQPERPIYENLNLTAEGPENPILRGFAQWLKEDVLPLTLFHGESAGTIYANDLWWTELESVAESFAGPGGTIFSMEIGKSEAGKYKTDTATTEYKIPQKVTKGRTRNRKVPGESWREKYIK